MSDWPRVITDVMGDEMHVLRSGNCVVIDSIVGNESVSMMLTVDQCAALIAAITDAAKVVTGEKA